MEHGASERVKEQSHTVMPVKTEVDKAAQSTAYHGVQTNANFTEEEPGLAELVKSEPALLVQAAVAEDGWQDIPELQCIQGPSTSAIVGSANVLDSVADMDNVFNVKEELGAIDIGPTVLQHTDTWYTTNQKDVSVVKEERAINHDKTDPILCGGVKEGIIEDEQRADTDDQLSNKASQSEQRQLYSCDECAKTYTKKDSLLQHYRNLHSTESHKCTKCNNKFPSKAYLYRHTSIVHSEQQYECAVCKKIYRSKPALNSHVYHVHRPRPAGSGPRIYICDYCQTTFKIKANLTTHITQVHARGSYNCSQCNRSFKCEPYLMMHVARVHNAGSGPRIYICDYCQTTFKIKANLTTHITQVHARGSYNCSQCNRSFKCEPYLMMHVARVHNAADTDDQRSNEASQSEQRQLYSCDECAKTYTKKDSLLQHYRNLHSTESHKCTKCNKKFPSKAYLYSHTSIVHSEQQYECAVCKKICRSKRALYQHVYQVHRPRPTGSHQLDTCTNCGKNFKYKLTCQRHEKRGKCTRPTASTSAVASTSRQQHNVVIVKEEPADGELELGPVVFQHMDCNYRPYEQEPGLD